MGCGRGGTGRLPGARGPGRPRLQGAGSRRDFGAGAGVAGGGLRAGARSAASAERLYPDPAGPEVQRCRPCAARDIAHAPECVHTGLTARSAPRACGPPSAPSAHSIAGACLHESFGPSAAGAMAWLDVRPRLESAPLPTPARPAQRQRPRSARRPPAAPAARGPHGPHEPRPCVSLPAAGVQYFPPFPFPIYFPRIASW